MCPRDFGFPNPCLRWVPTAGGSCLAAASCPTRGARNRALTRATALPPDESGRRLPAALQAVHGRSGLWRHDEKPPCSLRVSARRVSVASDRVRDRTRNATRRRAGTESVVAAVCHHRPVHVTVAQWLVLATSVVAAATVQGVVGFGSNLLAVPI